jgi:hypothetical protein
MFAPEEAYQTEEILTIYDVRVPGVAERFDRERLGWGEAADVETLDLDHPVLIIRPGGARGLGR